MAPTGQRLAFTGFRSAFEGADFLFVSPHERTVRVLLPLGFVELFHVVGVALENYASFLGVNVDDDSSVAIACVGQAAPGPHHVRGRRSAPSRTSGRNGSSGSVRCRGRLRRRWYRTRIWRRLLCSKR